MATLILSLISLNLSNTKGFYLTLCVSIEMALAPVFLSQHLAGQNIQLIISDSIPLSSGGERSAQISTSSCAARFILFIQENGLIFPCSGMSGVSNFCLGSMYDEFEDTAFVNMPFLGDLEELAVAGPQQLNCGCSEGIKGRTAREPLICALHRECFKDEKFCSGEWGVPG